MQVTNDGYKPTEVSTALSAAGPEKSIDDDTGSEESVIPASAPKGPQGTESLDEEPDDPEALERPTKRAKRTRDIRKHDPTTENASTPKAVNATARTRTPKSSGARYSLRPSQTSHSAQSSLGEKRFSGSKVEVALSNSSISGNQRITKFLKAQEAALRRK